MHVSDRILNAIGAEAMTALVREFGGDTLYIPNEVPNPDRDQNIIRLFSDTVKDGASNMTAYATCAHDYSLTTRRVQDIVAGR